MQATNAAYQAHQSERMPPIKVLGSGQPPLNWACEKSKPGFCKGPKKNNHKLYYQESHVRATLVKVHLICTNSFP